MLITDIILASQSSFRRKLLDSTGMRFSCVVSPFDEYTLKDLAPDALALGRAKGKAFEVARRHPQSLVIGADQVLSFQGKCFDKVATKEEAFQRIKSLSGSMHELVNGMCFAYSDLNATSPTFLYETINRACIYFRDLNDDDIHHYLNRSLEWQNVVGCYQYENTGIHLIDRVEGDHSEIIGLPLATLLAALRKLGIDTLANPAGPWEIA